AAVHPSRTRTRRWESPMIKLYRMSIAAFVALVAATSLAEATCGDLGGPGYRGPNGECGSWGALSGGGGHRPARQALEREPLLRPRTRRVRVGRLKSKKTASTNSALRTKTGRRVANPIASALRLRCSGRPKWHIRFEPMYHHAWKQVRWDRAHQ